MLGLEGQETSGKHPQESKAYPLVQSKPLSRFSPAVLHQLPRYHFHHVCHSLKRPSLNADDTPRLLVEPNADGHPSRTATGSERRIEENVPGDRQGNEHNSSPIFSMLKSPLSVPTSDLRRSTSDLRRSSTRLRWWHRRRCGCCRIFGYKGGQRRWPRQGSAAPDLTDNEVGRSSKSEEE